MTTMFIHRSRLLQRIPHIHDQIPQYYHGTENISLKGYEYLTCSLLRLIIPESSMSCPLEMLLLRLLCRLEEPQSARVHRDFVIRTPRVSCSSLSSSYRVSERLEEEDSQDHNTRIPKKSLNAQRWTHSRPHARDVT